MIDHWQYPPQYQGFGMGPSSSYSSGSSSARSSHLSILTTTSSISSALSSTSSDHVDQHSPSSASEQSSSSGVKTNAFFASPFSSPTSIPPPLHAASLIASDADITPRIPPAPAPAPLMTPASKKSLNDSFFSPPWQAAPHLPSSDPESAAAAALVLSPTSFLPSPPPSVAGTGPSTRLPPLSRLFPSRVRYTTVDALPSREGSPQGHHPIASSPPRQAFGRRQFLELDPTDFQQSHARSSRECSSPEPTSPVRSHAHEEVVESPRSIENLVFSPPPPSSSALPTAGPSKLPTPVPVTTRQVHQAAPSPLASSVPAQAAPVLRPGDVILETYQPARDDITQAEASNVGDATSASAFAPPPNLELVLVRTLGQGAFSSVWLARDGSGKIGKLEVVRKSSLRREKSKKGSLRLGGRKSSWRKRATRASESSDDGHSDKAVEGAVPKIRLPSDSGGLAGGDGALVADVPGHERESAGDARTSGRLVALKMTERSLCDKDDRTRVSFVREVEVLKHISHPSIVSYIHAFSTPSHHVLVLEHISGGELFDLVSSQEIHARLDEPLLRRIFGELCRAVGWMHAVGLVHRDIKLENILLTRNAFVDPSSPAPLIKLTDFGLSRFIDPAAPLLTTRCGSESYAAPELVTGRPYDGRETDAWACGVVLYALVTRRLPFDAMNPPPDSAALTSAQKDHDIVESKRVRGPRRDERSERRALLMRIAKGEYSWLEHASVISDAQPHEPLTGTALARSEGVRRIVGRLLVRDPRKRAKVAQVWDDEWFDGQSVVEGPVYNNMSESAAGVGSRGPVTESPTVGSESWDAAVDMGDDEDVWDEDEDDEGVLVDEQDIGPGSVACQEH